MQEATNAELTRRGFELWNERRFESLLECFHEDAVWDMRPFGIPDMSVFRGHQGLKRFFDGGIGHWRGGRLDFVENHPDMDLARIAFERYASAQAPVPVQSEDG